MILIRKLRLWMWIFCFTTLTLTATPTWAIIRIVAAENFYGEVAKQLGGDYVEVISILQNSQQDPHLFSATPRTAKATAEADIVVYNGANYDAWMEKLLSIPGKKTRQIIAVAELMGVKSGQNPHVWYAPTTMQVYAEVLRKALIIIDPVHQSEYRVLGQQFADQQQEFEEYVQRVKKQVQGMPVAATEPIFDDMAVALSLKMRDTKFQQSVANEGSPAPSAVKELIDDLTSHRVKALIYNQQVSDPLIESVKAIAQKNGITLVGVTETQPVNSTYHHWMRAQLDQLIAAKK